MEENGEGKFLHFSFNITTATKIKKWKKKNLKGWREKMNDEAIWYIYTTFEMLHAVII